VCPKAQPGEKRAIFRVFLFFPFFDPKKLGPLRFWSARKKQSADRSQNLREEINANGAREAKDASVEILIHHEGHKDCDVESRMGS